MLEACELDDCPRPRQVGLTICAVHRVQLTDALEAFPELADELETTRTRQSRIASGSGTAGGSLPWAAAAADLARALPAALDSWAVRLNHWIGTPWAHHRPGQGVEASCRFLLDRMPGVLSLPELPELCGKLLALHAACTAAIDRPPDRVYVGRCDECGQPVFAWPGRPVAKCRCGWTVDAAERRTQLLEAAEDAVLPAVDVSRACTSLGAPVTPAAIRQWKARGKLEPVACDLTRKAPLYRVGEVLDLIA